MAAPFALPVNKWLGTLTNLVAYAETANTLQDGNMNAFIESYRSTNVDFGAGKVIRSIDPADVSDLSQTSTLLTQATPDVREETLFVTNYKVVQMSINEYLLRGAFVNETQMATFIAEILASMRASKQIYLYRALIDAQEAYAPTQLTQTVTVNMYDVNGLVGADLQNTLAYNSNQIYKAFLNTMTEMGAPTSAFNDQTPALTEIINYDELKLVINSYFNNSMIVDSLASLLNSGKITDAIKWGETYVIPQAQLDTSNRTTVIGWLEHRLKIQFGYFYEVATSFFDASTLTTNNWLHFAYYMGEVDALPAVKFVANVTTPPTQTINATVTQAGA